MASVLRLRAKDTLIFSVVIGSSMQLYGRGEIGIFLSLYYKMPYVGDQHFDLKDPQQKRAYFREYQREYRKKNLEKLQQYAKDYIKKRIENDPEYKEVYRQQRKRWHDAHREKNNRRIRERAKQLWANNPEHRTQRLEYAKNRYATDTQFRENMLSRFKQRYRDDEEFREKLKAYNLAYRRRKREEKLANKNVK